MWQDKELQDLFLNSTPLIDVRSPVEFKQGMIPNSVNLPLLNDHERALIGTCYKQLGQEEAIKLGHKLIQGPIKEERISRWVEFLKTHPEGEVFCFRGGLRSSLSCEWLKERGFQKKPLSGGYKRLRQFFLSWLEEGPYPEIFRIGGLTGSGKTELLKKLSSLSLPVLDLEKLAHHKGSAFGGLGPQPSQVSFENQLALKICQFHQRKIFLEDESAVIGQLIIPRRLFQLMRSSKLLILEASLEERVRRIYEEYVLGQKEAFFLNGLVKIKKRFSSGKFQKLQAEISSAYASSQDFSRHAPWIESLLRDYYDPLYEKDLRRQEENIIFTGDQSQVMNFILGQTTSFF